MASVGRSVGRSVDFLSCVCAASCNICLEKLSPTLSNLLVIEVTMHDRVAMQKED